MGDASCATALIASPRLAQRRTPRLRAAFTAAVAPASVAYVAHHHLGLAACADEPSGADRPGKGPTRRSSCSHRRARSNLQSALRGRTNLPTLDGIARRCNTLRALVVDTVGRGNRNNFPVIAAVAPVLLHGEVLPRQDARRPPCRGLGGTPPVQPSSFKSSQPQRPRLACHACRGLEHRRPATPTARPDGLQPRPVKPPRSHRPTCNPGQFA
ncbi:hypothetical protein VAR608DRAFT_2786 [Variovorax sp. HW608]|nr:hypothetical protein VAR608DRAFT_2786 [Variovorax sp. HW608]